MITVPKRERSRKSKGRPRKATPPRSKVGRVCEWCGHVLAAGVLTCTCLGQGVPAAAQTRPAQSVTPAAVSTLAPDWNLPPLRYRTLAEWREAGRLPVGGPEDQDRPEPDMTFWVSSGAAVTGTASTSNVNREPSWLWDPPYGD